MLNARLPSYSLSTAITLGPNGVPTPIKKEEGERNDTANQRPQVTKIIIRSHSFPLFPFSINYPFTIVKSVTIILG